MHTCADSSGENIVIILLRRVLNGTNVATLILYKHADRQLTSSQRYHQSTLSKGIFFPVGNAERTSARMSGGDGSLIISSLGKITGSS